MHLSKEAAIQQVITPTAGAAGQTAINSSSVDLQNYRSVQFMIAMGAITAGATTSVKAQQSSDDGVGDAFSDLEGTNQAIADSDDGDIFYIDVVRPTKRYVRVVVSRADQDAVVAVGIAQAYDPRKMPVSHGAVVNGETHISPAEGTA